MLGDFGHEALIRLRTKDGRRKLALFFVRFLFCIDMACRMSKWWGLKRNFDIFFESGVKDIKETIPEYSLPHGINWKERKES